MALSELEKQTYMNGTFDLSILEEVINEIKINSYNYLYKTQLQLINYKRFDLHINDFILVHPYKDQSVYPKKYIKNIEIDFIATQNKKIYKNSSFHNKEISIFDIANNINVFSNGFMVFIDGKFFDSVKLTIKDEVTYLIFNVGSGTTGFTETYFNTLITKNSQVTVIFMPNCFYNPYITNITTLQKYKSKLSLPELNLAAHIDTTLNYINYINTLNLKFSAITLDPLSTELLKFYNNTLNAFDNKVLHLNIFGLIHLLKKIDVRGDEKYFSIDIQNMPIPIDNILIFKNINGVKYFAHNISLKLYYPNIYEIIGNTDNNDLTFFVIYSDDTPNIDDLKFQNELSLYYNITTNIIDKYKNNFIPDIIKNYNPMEFIYDINDYTNSDSYLDHLKYKIDKFESWCAQNSELLRMYLSKQNLNNNGYYLDISNIDLSTRYRLDNRSEIDYVSEQEDFTEPRYVFIINTDYLNLKFFIDGLFYIPDKIFSDTNYTYYYIPTSLVNSKSILDIEKPVTFNFNANILFTTLDYVETITLPDSTIEIYANDIFVINTTANNVYVDNTSFKMLIEKDGELIELDVNSSFNLKEFKIAITDPNLINKQLTLYIQKDSFQHQCDSSNSSIDPIFGVLTFTGNETINRDRRNFRLFKNGQLLTNDTFSIIYPEYLSGNYQMITNIVIVPEDKLILEYTPTKYRQVLYLDTIGEGGFVDLQGITKPFDLKWYDVYINGYKLNTNNIDIISPTKIFLKDVKSLKNFVILEKDIGDDIFSISTNSSSPSDTLWNNISEIQTIVSSGYVPIIDILPDMNGEFINRIGIQLFDFYNTIMSPDIFPAPGMFINPDVTNVFTEEMLTTYPDIFTIDDILFINPDDGENIKTVMEIFP